MLIRTQYSLGTRPSPSVGPTSSSGAARRAPPAARGAAAPVGEPPPLPPPLPPSELELLLERVSAPGPLAARARTESRRP
jgi:hypothetical protein